MDAAAPIQTEPLYVRAGSIVPLGLVVQYVGEKPEDPIELRVYCGADGAFTLYEDDGNTYAYEKGARATLPITWHEAAGTLTIGAREGNFPGMLSSRTFRVVFVDKSHGVGLAETEQADQVVKYSGKAVLVKGRPGPDS